MYTDNLGYIPFASIFTKAYYKKLVWGFNNKWWGRIDYSTTLRTEQTKETGFFYAFSDFNIADGRKSVGLGINVFGWVGLEVGAIDSGDLSIGGNLTPWFNFGVSIGASGISLSMGVNIDETNHEFTIGIGLAPAIIIVGVASIVLSCGQTFSTVMSWFGKIFSF